MDFIDLFAGVGGFRRGMELAGHRCVGFCEWDKFATASYTSMHLITPEQRQFLKTLDKKKRQKEILKEEYRNGEWYVSDICDVTGENVPDCDCWCFGAPCFVAGTMVITREGEKPIEQIQKGDMVLTHKNRFRKVVKPMKSIKRDIYTVYTDRSSVTCTSNHRFRVCYYEQNIRTAPTWLPVCDFTGQEYVQSLKDQEESWEKVREISREENRIEIVYNMEVEDDNSYTANSYGVHNCQDFSQAGRRAGLAGDRSSLIREVFRILGEIKEEDRPEWLIYENVRGMLSSNRGFDYLAILTEMDGLGYDIQWQNFNSKDWGVPQNRERIYTIGHLRRYGRKEFLPLTPADGENCSASVNQIGRRPNKKRDNPQVFRVYDPMGVAPCLNTMEGGGREPFIPVECIDKRYQGVDGQSRVYEENIPTLSARDYKEPLFVTVPHVFPVVDPCRANKDMNGRRFKEDEEPSFALTTQDRHGVALEVDTAPVVMPVLTPDREKKRQNGRRFKDNAEPAFTLTAQDKHGVAIGIQPVVRSLPGFPFKVSPPSFSKVLPAPFGIDDTYGFTDIPRIFQTIVPTIRSERYGLKVGIPVDSQALGVLRSVRSDYGKEIRKDYESGNVKVSRHSFLEKEVKEDGVSNTVDTVQHDNLLAMKTEPVGGCYTNISPEFNHGILEDCSRTIKANNHDAGVALAVSSEEKEHPGIYVQFKNTDYMVYAVWYEKYQCYIAIRKLTPKECFRLQGWDDVYFERAEFVNSNSQLYRQAGNGVTVNVVYEIAKHL